MTPLDESRTKLTIALTLLCLNERSVGSKSLRQQTPKVPDELPAQLTVVDLDGAVDVERNFEVLERVQNRIVDIKLLPTRTRCQ